MVRTRGVCTAVFGTEDQIGVERNSQPLATHEGGQDHVRLRAEVWGDHG